MINGVRSWNERVRSYCLLEGESLTHQSFKEESDINRILKRYSDTGVLPQSDNKGTFADVSGLQVELTQAHLNSLDTMKRFEEFQRNAKKKQQASQPSQPESSPQPQPAASQPQPAASSSVVPGGQPAA